MNINLLCEKLVIERHIAEIVFRKLYRNRGTKDRLNEIVNLIKKVNDEILKINLTSKTSSAVYEFIKNLLNKKIKIPNEDILIKNIKDEKVIKEFMEKNGDLGTINYNTVINRNGLSKEIIRGTLTQDVVSNKLRRNEFIVIDVETESLDKNLPRPRMILLTAYNVKKNELKTFYELNDEFLYFIDMSVIIAHNSKFDFNFLKQEIINNGWKLFAETNIISSSAKKIVTGFVFFKNNKFIEFAMYDSLSLIPLALSDISKIVLETKTIEKCIPSKLSPFLAKKGYAIDYDDEIHKKINNVLIELKSFSNKNIVNVVNEIEKNIVFNNDKIEFKNDTALKFLACLENPDIFINYHIKQTDENRDKFVRFLQQSEIYNNYNKRDVAILSIFMMFYEYIFAEALNIKYVPRKLTISSIAYGIIQETIVKSICKKLNENREYLSLLNYEEINENKFEKITRVKYINKFNEYTYYTHSKIFIRINQKYYVIFYKKNRLENLKKAYYGGLVVGKQGKYGKGTQLDINSSYPNSMVMSGINPFSKALCVDDLELIKKHVKENDEILNKSQKWLSKKIVEKMQNSRIYKKASEKEKELFDLSAKGYLTIIIYGKLKDVPTTSSVGLIHKVNNKNYNCVGKFNTNAFYHIYDLISVDADVDIKKMLITLCDCEDLRKIVNHLYLKRLEYKNNNNAFEGIIKLILNSSYGKFACSHSKEFNRKIRKSDSLARDLLDITPKKHIKSALIKLIRKFKLQHLDDIKISKRICIINKKKKIYVEKKNSSILVITYVFKNVRRKYIFTESSNTLMLKIEKEMRYQAKQYNIICAIHITALARINLINYINLFEKNGYRFLYSDTDSLIVENYENENIFDNDEIIECKGTDLGKLKVESRANKVIIAGKKLYVFNKVKCKGVKRTDLKPEDIERLLDEKTINVATLQMAQSFDDEAVKLVEKKIRLLDNCNVINIEDLRRMIEVEKLC